MIKISILNIIHQKILCILLAYQLIKQQTLDKTNTGRTYNRHQLRAIEQFKRSLQILKLRSNKTRSNSVGK